MERLSYKESAHEPGRLNKSSLACGIPQSLPCTKLYPHATNAWIRANMVERNGKWYLPNPDTKRETEWMATYVKRRYSTPTNALIFHKINNWY